MLKVAIVEDTPQDALLLQTHLRRYADEYSVPMEIAQFPNAIQFLQRYRGEYGIIFMDIDMPVLNGMNAAHQLRQIDPSVVLIFVTALARYAVNGYEVNASDFVVKPVQYPTFSAKLSRVLKQLSVAERKKLLIRSGDKSVRVFVDEICYVEILGHTLTFHTARQDIATRGSMKDVVKSLGTDGFAMCNKSCLLNLNHVQLVKKDEAVMDNGDRIAISSSRKTEFMQSIADFYNNMKINMGRY